MNKRSIIFTLPWNPAHPGGVTHVVASLAQTLEREASFTPVILQQSWDHPRADYRSHEGRTVVELRLRSPWGPTGGARAPVAFALTLAGTLRKLANIVRTTDAACINVHYPGLSAFNFLFLRWVKLYRGAIVLSFHGTDVEDMIASHGVERLLWRILISRADRTISCSRDLRDKVAAFATAASSRCFYVHNGIDAEGTKRELAAPPECAGLASLRYVVHCGAFIKRKGYDVLVRAFAKIAPEFPEVRLVLVGDPAQEYANISDLVKTLGLADRVRMIGLIPHAQVLWLIRQAALLVLPSRYEAFGLVLLEAGVFARPVIASDVGGIPEIVIDNVTGLLVAAEDEAGLAARLSYLLSRPDDAVALGDNLRRHVTSNFALDKLARRYIEALTDHEIVKRK